MQKLTLTNKRGQNIVGILSVPQDKQIIGTAILQHGYGSTKESATIMKLQEIFLAHGFQVFNFDSPNSVGESDGEYEEALQSTHADDFEHVVFWVKEQDWFTGKLAIAGISMGGFSVLKFSQDHHGMVDYTIALVPVTSGPMRIEVFKEQDLEMFQQWEQTGMRLRESLTRPGLIRRTPWAFVEDLQKQDLFPGAKKITNPALLVAGGRDTWIPPTHVQMFFDEMGDIDKTFEIIPDAPHTFSRYGKEMEAIIAPWLRQRI